MRGGHQMCIDEENQIIFLLGGWDGTKDLSDFWVYNIQIERWHCISEDTKADVNFMTVYFLDPLLLIESKKMAKMLIILFRFWTPNFEKK